MWDGLAWLQVAPAAAGINDGIGSVAFHVVSPTEIYAVLVNNGAGRIAMSDGNVWTDMTEPMLGMKYELGVMPGGIYYAVIGTEIQKWTGILGDLGAWAILAPEQLGLRGAMQVVSDTEIYAVIDDKVCKWDGLAWTDITLDMAGLKTAYTRTSDEDIMAVAGLGISHWAPVAAP